MPASRMQVQAFRAALATVGAALLAAGCTGRSEPPVAIRLVDLHTRDTSSAAPPQPGAAGPQVQWRFDTPPAAPGSKPSPPEWEAGPGVSGAGIRDGRLRGTSSTDFPLLRFACPPTLSGDDPLHAVEVRLAVGGGANLSVSWSTEAKVDLEKEITDARDFAWLDSSPLVTGDEARTYTLRLRRPPRAGQTRHLLLRPTDVPGASFAIESVRLVTRREHLAGIRSGVGWQGLSEIYRETLVARAPETLDFDVDLPARPWLDLGLGTVEDGPATFSVAIDGRPLLERTLTTPQRWENAPVDLAAFAGRRVRLSLTMAAPSPGTIGLWGSPAIRNRGAMPAAATAVAGAGDPPQGVILIWADTLRRDHLDVYGHGRPTAPHLTRLAAEGAVFNHCIAQATWTKVSTPSLFTSLYPTSHTVVDFSDRLPAAAETLAEAYRAAGFATLSMSSVLFTGAFTNLHQGFEELHEDRSVPNPESSKTARTYVDRLLPWLEAHREDPFFVFLHVTDPHDPFRPEPPYDTMWADASRNDAHEADGRKVREAISDPLLKRFGMPTRAELERAGLDPDAYVAHDRDWYDGSIRGMDAEIGRLVERLRSLGLERRTLLVFTSDHGEEFLEHGRMFHGQSVYGELTNVPLVLWRPGAVPAGTVVDDTVRIIDVMPTLLAASRLPAPEGMQGRDLLPLLAGGAAAPGPSVPAVAEKAEISPVAGGGPPPRDTESYALILDGWKLIHNTKRPRGGPEFELYDARRDPLDAKNVAAEQPEVVVRLAAELQRWRAGAEAARLKRDGRGGDSMSSEELERLRSLGYIQ